MQPDAQRYLEHLCDTATATATATARTPLTSADSPRAAMLAGLAGAGVEPFGFGAALRFSPARTKVVMRELLQYNLLGIAAVRGDDGRNELRMTPNGETARWYARVLRARRIVPEAAHHLRG